MRLVVDANILFAALIKEGKIAELLTDHRLELFVPEHLFSELSEHKRLIIRKTQRQNPEQLISAYKEFLAVIPGPFPSIKIPDPDDAPHVGAALKLCCPIWSNDRRLKEQEIVQVMTTEELIGVLSSR